MRIVFLGDSLTEGIDGASYLRVLSGLLTGDRRVPTCELINAGRGGDTVLHLMRRVAADVVPHAPEWVVVFVGVNDCTTWRVRRSWPTRDRLNSGYYFLRQKGIWRAVTPTRYGAGLRALVDMLRTRTQAHIALCTPAMASEWQDARAERMLDAYVDRALAIATERADALIDMRAAFAEAIKRTGVHPRGGYHLSIDGVHLNDAGAALAAATIRDWLLTL
jgi:lysophospholipase L1-like esterase